MRIISVDYLDAVNGGSGFVRMRLDELEGWLGNRPGVLIRKITTVQII